jgi:hypothetical protein
MRAWYAYALFLILLFLSMSLSGWVLWIFRGKDEWKTPTWGRYLDRAVFMTMGIVVAEHAASLL